MTNRAIRPVLQPVKIIYSYAYEDDHLREQLARQLSPLRNTGRITTWFDRDIRAGTEKSSEISVKFNEADIILLLLSPDFMASNYLYSVEMQTAIKKHKAGIAWVIPIVLRPVAWEDTPIGMLQCLPYGGKPITLWKNRDEAFLTVVQGIREVMTEVSRTNQEPLLHLPLNKQQLITVAIDLGTSHSGFAYALRNGSKIWVWEDWPGAHSSSSKTATALLYSPDGQVEAWGFEALEKFSAYGRSRMSNYYFISKFTMQLHENDSITSNNREFLVSDLITDYLKKLKEFAFEEIKKRLFIHEECEVFWCLTIPASRTFEQRKKMRLIAQKAGLVLLNSGKQLLLISRPEAAIIGYLEQEHSSFPSTEIKVGTCFILVDMGNELEISTNEIQRNDDGYLDLHILNVSTHYFHELELAEDRPETIKSFSQPFFERVITDIEKHLAYLDAHRKTCSFLCLIGEPSTFLSLRETIKRRFSRKVGQVVVPEDPATVILRGAVSLGIEPSIIRDLCTAFTYGIQASLPFDPRFDTENNKILDERLGIWLCPDRFDIFVTAGQSISPDQVVVRRFFPVQANQRQIAFSVYRTRERQVRYINEKHVRKVGDVILSRVDTDNGLDWEIEVTMYLGDTELQVEAKDVKSSNAVSSEISLVGSIV